MSLRANETASPRSAPAAMIPLGDQGNADLPADQTSQATPLANDLADHQVTHGTNLQQQSPSTSRPEEQRHDAPPIRDTNTPGLTSSSFQQFSSSGVPTSFPEAVTGTLHNSMPPGRAPSGVATAHAGPPSSSGASDSGRANIDLT